MEQAGRERRCLEGGLKADRRAVQRCEKAVERDEAEIRRLHQQKITVLARGEDVSLFEVALSAAEKMLRDHRAALEVARQQAAVAESALQRHDDRRRADELERLAGQLTADRVAIDGAMETLAERFRGHRETMLRIAQVDREAGRHVTYPHKYALPARLAAIKAGLPSFVPTDHVANSKGGRRLAEMEEPALHRRIRELRGEREDVAA